MKDYLGNSYSPFLENHDRQAGNGRYSTMGEAISWTKPTPKDEADVPDVA